MSGIDWLVLGVIAVIIFIAVRKIVKDRKNGAKCPGCNCSGCKHSASSGNCAD